MRRSILLLCGILAASPFSSPMAWGSETWKYVILVHGGKEAGHQTVVSGDDGVVRSRFYFKDNGRGPEILEEFSLLPEGGFRHYRASGTTTFGSKVEERYDASDGRARWSSDIDKGEMAVVPGAFYSPLSGAGGESTALLRAMTASKDGSVPLMPSGRLRMQKVDRVQVSRGGDSRWVNLVQITGWGFTPAFLWVTDDAQPRTFASIAPGYRQLIEDGWQSNASALEARQKVAEEQVLQGMQRRLAHPLEGATLIRDVRVFDSGTATLSPRTSVLIRDGRIVSVGAGDAGARGANARVANVLDGGGRVLLPGLFDMHAHMDNWSGGLDIAAGVTSVRDMGNDNATLQETMRMERAGRLLMPRIVATGFLEGESPMSARMGFVVKDLPEARRAIDWYASHGYPQIKIYNSFPKVILKDTVAYAHAKGLRVSGHIPVFLRAQDAVEAGYDEIQHINQVVLNFLVDEKTDTRTLERFYLPAKKVADLDFDSKPVQDFIGLLRRKGTVVDPTLDAFQFLSQRNGEQLAAYQGIEDHLPANVVRNGRSASLDIPDDATAERYRKSVAKLGEFTMRLYRAGVPIVAGTDDVPGFALQRELALYVESGMTPAQALQIATRNGARYSYVEDLLGSVAPGKTADLVLVDGDPTRDITDLRKVATVIKGDTVYYPAEIYAELGIKPFAQPVRPVANQEPPR